jgi:hypothetical protein
MGADHAVNIRPTRKPSGLGIESERDPAGGVGRRWNASSRGERVVATQGPGPYGTGVGSGRNVQRFGALLWLSKECWGRWESPRPQGRLATLSLGHMAWKSSPRSDKVDGDDIFINNAGFGRPRSLSSERIRRGACCFRSTPSASRPSGIRDVWKDGTISRLRRWPRIFRAAFILNRRFLRKRAGCGFIWCPRATSCGWRCGCCAGGGADPVRQQDHQSHIHAPVHGNRRARLAPSRRRAAAGQTGAPGDVPCFAGKSQTVGDSVKRSRSRIF